MQMDFGIFNAELIARIVNLILLLAMIAIGRLYSLKVTLADAPRKKLAVITIIVAAIIVLGIALTRTDSGIGDLISSILGEYIIVALEVWFLVYIIWIGRPYRRAENQGQN